MACDISTSVEQYIQPYGLHGALLRLHFIATNATSPEQANTRKEALNLGLRYVKQSSNVNLYQDLHNIYKEKLNEEPPAPLDILWMENTEKASLQLKASFEEEIANVKMSHVLFIL